MRTLLTTLASVLLLLAGSCTSPLATLKGGPALPPVGPGETQLVFHLNSGAKAANYSYTVAADVKYLVVQLHSKYGQSSKFAAAAVSSGIAVVNISGLVAGPWEILVSAYDWDGVTGGTSPWAGSADNTQPTLLYTAMDQMSIQPGTSTPVNLLLYKPGDLGGVTLTEALMVNNVTLSPMAPLASIPTSVIAGSAPFQVVATAWNVLAVTAASDQNFSWYSDNPDVAYVDNAGNVFPKNPGTTKITAMSRESEKYGTNKFAQFTLTVDPVIVGLWKAHVTTPTVSDRYAIIKPSGSGYVIRYLDKINTSMYPPTHSISTLTPNGSNSWLFDTNRNVDLTTGTESTWAGTSFGVTQLDQNSIKILTPPTAPTETVTYQRVMAPVLLSSLTLPTGNLKTGQILNGKDLGSPANTEDQVYLSYTGGMATFTDSSNRALQFSTTGSITITARSVFDPSIATSRTYTIDLAVPTPTNLAVVPMTNLADNTVYDHSISLSWTYTPPGTLLGVNLYRSTDGVNFSLIMSSIIGNNYSDGGLTAGTAYWYRLEAIGGDDGGTIYTNSPMGPVLSVCTTTGGYPTLVYGPAVNPDNYMQDFGNGMVIPAMYTSGPPTGYLGIQGFDSTAKPIASVPVLRAGQNIWVVASLPQGTMGTLTLIKKWDQKYTPGGMGVLVNGVSKVYDITSLGSGAFKLWGAGATTGTISWNPTTMDFVTP